MVAPFSKFELVFVLTQEKAFFQSFIVKPTERVQALLKDGTRDFENTPPFERPACFYVTITGNFKRFQCFKFETNFVKNETFSKNWSTVFKLKVLRLQTQHFHAKLPCQKSMLGQIEWGIQNRPITKSGVLTGNTFFFLNFVSV